MLEHFQALCKKLKNATWEFDRNHFLAESLKQNMQMMISLAINLLLLRKTLESAVPPPTPPPSPSTVTYIQHLDLICLFFQPQNQSASRTVPSVHTDQTLTFDPEVPKKKKQQKKATS